MSVQVGEFVPFTTNVDAAEVQGSDISTVCDFLHNYNEPLVDEDGFYYSESVELSGIHRAAEQLTYCAGILLVASSGGLLLRASNVRELVSESEYDEACAAIEVLTGEVPLSMDTKPIVVS